MFHRIFPFDGYGWEILQVSLPTLAPADDLLIDSDRQKDSHREQEHGDRVCGEPIAEKDKNTERVGERGNRQSEEDNCSELSKDRDRGKESERAEFGLQHSEKKFEKALMLDSNTPNVGPAGMFVGVIFAGCCFGTSCRPSRYPTAVP